MKPLALFDLDGTLRDTGPHLYPRAHQISILSGVAERLLVLRREGYLLAGITNQGGVAKKDISQAEVRACIERTQELLGPAKLDAIFYCPHHRDYDPPDCDCKKPSVGMALDALTELKDSTLEGGFIVGDSSADAGTAEALHVPFLDAHDFRHMPIDGILSWLRKIKNSSGATAPNDRVEGCLVGMAVGDALGAPLEFQARESVRKRYPIGLREMTASRLWAKGEYTDDTQMALLLAQSLLRHKAFVPQDVASAFYQWASTAKDVGVQTRSVLAMSGYRDHPESCARQYYRQYSNASAGNGAVMRCAPVAVFHSNSPSMLVADSRRSARVTHADPKAQSSCVILNVWIAAAIQEGVRDAREYVMKLLPPAERSVWGRLYEIEQLPDAQIKSNGFTVHTVEASIWSFLTTDSYEEAVVRAANLGDDADTVACVTGALAGAYYGYKSIPSRWRDELKDEKQIRSLAVDLSAAESNSPIVSGAANGE